MVSCRKPSGIPLTYRLGLPDRHSHACASHEHMHARYAQSCPTLCSPMGCSLPGSSVHGILQARIMEWVAMPSFRGSSQPRDGTCACIAGGFLTAVPPGKFKQPRASLETEWALLAWTAGVHSFCRRRDRLRPQAGGAKSD